MRRLREYTKHLFGLEVGRTPARVVLNQRERATLERAQTLIDELREVINDEYDQAWLDLGLAWGAFEELRTADYIEDGR